ncbi:MAG: HTH domain-containing protein, partial [Desulfofundulus sp.]
MELSKRQEAILEIVKKEGPITGEQIAERLSLTRATLRPDMAILTMAGLLEARPRVGYYYSGKTPNKVIAEKLHRIKVGEVKSVPVVVSEHCSVYDAVVTMFIEDVGTL